MMAFTQYETQTFINHYLAAAETLQDDERSSDDELNLSWSDEARKRAGNDCIKFLKEAYHPLNEALNENGYGMEQAGNDFFLTRNGHGAGFWDRGLGSSGEAMSLIARSMGESSTFILDGKREFEFFKQERVSKIQ
jgi:hypothetical protein